MLKVIYFSYKYRLKSMNKFNFYAIITKNYTLYNKIIMYIIKQ